MELQIGQTHHLVQSPAGGESKSDERHRGHNARHYHRHAPAPPARSYGAEDHAYAANLLQPVPKRLMVFLPKKELLAPSPRAMT
jgi:hypothetical protein